MAAKIKVLTSEYIKDIKKTIGSFPKETSIRYLYKLSGKFSSNIHIKPRSSHSLDVYTIRALYYKILKMGTKKFVALGDESVIHEFLWLDQNTHLDFSVTLIIPNKKKNYPYQKNIEIITDGKSLKEARERSSKLAKAKDYPCINLYEDSDIISTYGTIALEFLRDEKSLEMIVVPVIHGTLISGISIFTKEILPQVKIIGVYRKGGLSLNKKTSQIIKEYVDDLYPISEDTLNEANKIYKEELSKDFAVKNLLPIAFLFEDKISIKNRSLGLVL